MDTISNQLYGPPFLTTTRLEPQRLIDFFYEPRLRPGLTAKTTGSSRLMAIWILRRQTNLLSKAPVSCHEFVRSDVVVVNNKRTEFIWKILEMSVISNLKKCTACLLPMQGSSWLREIGSGSKATKVMGIHRLSTVSCNRGGRMTSSHIGMTTLRSRWSPVKVHESIDLQ